jgi:hypothetical protein
VVDQAALVVTTSKMALSGASCGKCVVNSVRSYELASDPGNVVL